MEMQLAQCIERSVSATVSPEERRTGLVTYNAFKESKDLGVMAAALTLCQGSNGCVARHGALLLVEHWIRLRWNELEECHRVQLKFEVHRWIQDAGNIMQQTAHVKEGICRVTVEIVKREWPQKWPDLMPTLFTVAECGMAQTELVLLILLRIAEDVVQLQTLKDVPQRRKDVHQALIDHVPTLFEFLFKTLNMYYALRDSNPAVMAARVKLLKSALLTLTCYVEFVQQKEFLLDEVFKILCFLLNDPELRVQAAHCLCEIAARKFKGVELEQLCCKFLKQEVMSEILRCIGGALASPQQASDHSSTFVLALCETLAGVSRQLSTFILQSTQSFECPSTYVDLVHAVIQLCQHPSCVVARVALAAATALLKIEQRDSRKLAYPPDTLWTAVCKMIAQRLVFNDYPLSQWDFEDISELKRAYRHFRSELCDLLRVAVAIHPDVVVKIGLARLGELLQRSTTVSSGAVVQALDDQQTSASTDAVTVEEWIGIHRYLDAACSAIAKEAIQVEERTGILAQLVEAFDQLLSLHRAGRGSLDGLSHVASCCSSLSPFIVNDHARLGNLLDTVFGMAATEKHGESRATRSLEARDYRKHGTALFVRLCVDHPAQMIRHLGAIETTIAQRLSLDSVSGLERQHYLEGLTVLSNQMTDPSVQYTLLEQMLTSDLAFFYRDPGFLEAVSNVRTFAYFVGLQNVQAFEEAVERRASLTGKLMTITGVLKRCKSIQGRHVAFELITRTCLTGVLKLLWLFKELFAQREIIHPDILQSMMCLTEADKSTLFADNRPSCEFPVPKVAAAQGFGSVLQETLSQFLITLTYQPEFYSQRTDLASIILSGMEHFPSSKVRFYFHSVVRSFIKNCPESLLLPLFSSSFIPLMSTIFTMLDTRWQTWSMRNSSSDAQEESEATLDALVEDQVMYQMGRDLIDVVITLLLDPSKPPAKLADDDASEAVSSAISTFGETLLADKHACQCAITVAFTALHWGDTATSFKAVGLCRAVALHVIERHNNLDARCASFMFGAFLRSLRVHGDVEEQVSHLLSLGISLYRWLCRSKDGVRFAVILREMLANAGCDQAILGQFEKSLAPGVTMPHRKRKDLFSGLVKCVIKPSISTLGKEVVHIENLTPLWQMQSDKKKISDGVIELKDLFGQ